MTTKIHQFNPQIYPRMLWITVGADIKSLRDMFGADLEEMDEDALADVARVGTDKPKKRGGILIRFRSKKVMNHNTSRTNRITPPSRYSTIADAG